MLRRGLRFVLIALLASLVSGFLFGTWLRWQLERPVYYLGRADVASIAPG